MADSIKSTDELLAHFAEVAVASIAASEQGVVFFNEAGETLFVLPFAGRKEGD